MKKMQFRCCKKLLTYKVVRNFKLRTRRVFISFLFLWVCTVSFHWSPLALQVQWNDPGAHYSLLDKEKLPRFPFSIDQEGNIYVTQPLDREEKDSVSKMGRVSQVTRQSPMSAYNWKQNWFYLKKICIPNLDVLLTLNHDNFITSWLI
jgi:hypothetical protein